MKKIALLIVAIALFSGNVGALPIDLIQQNIKYSDKLYEQSILTIEQRSMPSRLWIHVRTESQKKIGEEIFKILADTSLVESRIEKKPLQIVDFGPEVSQLRYFKKKNKSQATELFSVLRKSIPMLKLKDLSSEYSHIRWIKLGHFELWLSPQLEHIESPE